MDELIRRIERHTEDVLAKLGEADPEQFEQLVEARDKLIAQIQTDGLSEEARAAYGARIRALLSHDPLIMGRMHELKQEASMKLVQVRGVRQQKSAYEKIITSEGYFFDKRK